MLLYIFGLLAICNSLSEPEVQVGMGSMGYFVNAINFQRFEVEKGKCVPNTANACRMAAAFYGYKYGGAGKNLVGGCFAYNYGERIAYFGTGPSRFSAATVNAFHLSGGDCQFKATAKCTPYTEHACQLAAKFNGLSVGGHGYDFVLPDARVSGCYTYSNGEYADSVFYGDNGSDSDRAGDTGRSGVVRPIGHDCVFNPPPCEPFSKQACEMAALMNGLLVGDEKRGYPFASADYGVKGCYAYDRPPYGGIVFYGTGGSLEARSKKIDRTDMYRPTGYNCKADAYGTESDVGSDSNTTMSVTEAMKMLFLIGFAALMGYGYARYIADTKKSEVLADANVELTYQSLKEAS